MGDEHSRFMSSHILSSNQLVPTVMASLSVVSTMAETWNGWMDTDERFLNYPSLSFFF